MPSCEVHVGETLFWRAATMWPECRAGTTLTSREPETLGRNAPHPIEALVFTTAVDIQDSCSARNSCMDWCGAPALLSAHADTG